MTRTQIMRIFLASSSELADDRKEFEIFINRENRSLTKNNVFLELVIWEDFIESMSKTRLQDEYNLAIHDSDIFIMLIHKRVGKYTLEEFESAFGQFKATGKPLIFIFFKDTPVNISELVETDMRRLSHFQNQLNSLGHFWKKYENIETLKEQFSAELDKLVRRYSKSEYEEKEKDIEGDKRNRVFISYSHRDKEFLERLLVHLKPLSKNGIIEIWDDTKLRPGDEWRKEIDKNLRTTGYAILLVSADFLASDFIVNNELYPLLIAARERGTRIVSIIIKPCRFTRDEKLNIYQAVNSPLRPLLGESEFEREKTYDKVAEWIEVYFSNQES